MSAGFPNPLATSAPDAAQMARIARILHDEAGIVLAPGKASMVQSRLAKRLRALDLPDYASYLDLVSAEAGSDERRRMISALTTNVSHFFREGHHFDCLRDQVLPPLIARLKAGGRVRIWSAGCSNGQEPWSIAMTVQRAFPDVGRHDFRILATDIDPEVLARARAASYEPAMTGGIPADMRQAFLEPDGAGLRITAPLQALVQFRELNLHAAWPMKGRFDVIFCRNVVIYFDGETQNRLWTRFAEALTPEGWLFVGHSERVAAGVGARFVAAGITSYRLSPTPRPPQMPA